MFAGVGSFSAEAISGLAAMSAAAVITVALVLAKRLFMTEYYIFKLVYCQS